MAPVQTMHQQQPLSRGTNDVLETKTA